MYLIYLQIRKSQGEIVMIIEQFSVIDAEIFYL